MAKFLSSLVIKDVTDDVWELHEPLIYESDIVGRVEVPVGFQTDLASVPKVPVVYMAWGGRCHYESVIHDAAYRLDFPGNISYSTANKLFLEAMEARGKSFYIRWPMYAGVVAGGWSSFRKKRMDDRLA